MCENWKIYAWEKNGRGDERIAAAGLTSKEWQMTGSRELLPNVLTSKEWQMTGSRELPPNVCEKAHFQRPRVGNYYYLGTRRRTAQFQSLKIRRSMVLRYI